MARVLMWMALWLTASVGIAVPFAAAQDQPPLRARVSLGLDPDTVTVGDPFRIAVRVDAPAGASVEFGDFPEDEALQPLGPARILPDTPRPGMHTAVYPLVAWRTGTILAPVILVRVAAPDAEPRTFRVSLPVPSVRSVLPADTAGIEPRAAKDILTTERIIPRWLLLMLVLLLLLGAAAVWRWASLRRISPPSNPPHRPREEALAELERARSLGLVEAGDWKGFFSLVSDALRTYLMAVSPQLGADLTTGEITNAVQRERVEPDAAAALEQVLRAADLVKFARYSPSELEAEATWSAAREVIEQIEPARPADAELPGVAA